LLAPAPPTLHGPLKSQPIVVKEQDALAVVVVVVVVAVVVLV
jgi:hypothetical protein